ncbi:MAG: alpha/beta hydrolase [Flavobacteriales bacterium]|nr:MAG: alpha/beta hydrolase [Flavobacteriales bacterium]
MNSKTIVFIHGLFMNAKSWDSWKTYFEKKGYNCIVPEYPFHKGEPAELRNNIPEGLGNLTLTEVANFYTDIITKLDEKPMLIGHSIGGLIVQILVNRDLAAKGVSIDPAPPKGVFSFKWSFLKSNLATINPLKGSKACLPSVKWFQYAFCNTMTMEETEKIYDEFVVPESRNVPRESTKNAGKIDFKKAHVPLLIIAGEKDNIIPSSLNKKNAKKYKHTGSVVDFKEFKDRTHILCIQQEWEEMADYIDNWIKTDYNKK